MRKSLTPRGTRGAILFLSKLQKSLSLTRKRAQVMAPGVLHVAGPGPAAGTWLQPMSCPVTWALLPGARQLVPFPP